MTPLLPSILHNTIQKKFHFSFSMMLSLIFTLTSIISSQAASAVRVYVVSPKENQVAETFVKSFEDVSPNDWHLTRVAGHPPVSTTPDTSIVICLGEKMLSQFCSDTSENLIFALFVTKERLDDLKAKLPAINLTGIYLDAPVQRQAELARLLLPGVTRAAILASQPLSLPTMSAAGQSFHIFQLSSQDELPRLLNSALEKNDYILGTPDFGIYNGRQIRQILLTAYRHNKVLIGPSLAFVNAGGLATSYSTAADYAHQAVEMINVYINTNNVPDPAFAKYFDVAVNRQVARSLNLVVPDADALQSKLMLLEAQP
ncbi:ABC transporter substrate-binding protein [Hahella ganghwensis]|uniref:ABC transporter substrate-binding protein n=1 Tax=Hahella ganghwensis TaxID=286420 RepID=UPI00035C2B78|nr:hypothetical protein [Hahella ganghwensis]